MPPKRKNGPAIATGNPLYVQWLREWEAAAAERQDRNMRYIYKKAADSLERYPVPFQHPREAVILTGIGPKIVRQLEQRLEQLCQENDLSMPTAPSTSTIAGRPLDAATSTQSTQPAAKRARVASTYHPRHRSGAFALLLGLLELERSGKEATKQVLIRAAQPYSDTSFTVPVGNGHYTAWNSINTLSAKALVATAGRPARYILTTDGQQLAEQLFRAEQSCQDTVTDDTATAREQPSVNPPQSSALPRATSQDAISALTATNARNRTMEQRDTARSVSSQFAPASFERPISCADQPFQYLDAHDNIVVRLEQAEQLVDPNSGIIRYRVCFDRRLEGQSAVRHVFRVAPSSTHSGKLTGYLDMGAIGADARQVGSQAPCSTTPLSDLNVAQLPSVPIVDLTQDGHKESGSVTSGDEVIPTTTSDASIPCAGLDERRLAVETAADILATPAESFEVVMLLDCRELHQRRDRGFLQRELQKQGISVELRALPLGDALWIARPAGPQIQAPVELLLDVIVERKQMDDLVTSLKDSRYQEQKHRLERCGLQHAIYLVEGYTPDAVRSSDSERVDSALATTLLSGGFFLKQTRTVEDTIAYFAAINDHLVSSIKGTRLCQFPYDLTQPEHSDAQRVRLNREPSQLMTRHLICYDDYAARCKKTLPRSVGHMMLSMLLAIPGVGREKAEIIMQRYPTPASLLRALLDHSEPSAQQRLLVHQDDLVPRRCIGAALSARIVAYWLGGCT